MGGEGLLEWLHRSVPVCCYNCFADLILEGMLCTVRALEGSLYLYLISRSGRETSREG